ncbi:hypothetical protein ALC60_14187 [Trachymyrmex zeteki]|uniref:Uncharacterized protein n=1 Tax=Mycetomoellerius zeteki TaxID=64791 RepID=A0A151WG35_9HYME|nr:hypothetical protein ALC60_14187 [Trachymyrmex zeteki]
MTVTPETSIVGAIDPRTQGPEELMRLRARISLSRWATQTICTSELPNKLANVHRLLQFNSPYTNASLGTSKRPLVTADNSSSKRERS